MGEGCALDGDHVEPHVAVGPIVLPQPTLGEPPNLLLLRHTDRRCGAAVTSATTRLDLTEHDQLIEHGDQVEIAAQPSLRGTPIATEDPETE